MAQLFREKQLDLINLDIQLLDVALLRVLPEFLLAVPAMALDRGGLDVLFADHAEDHIQVLRFLEVRVVQKSGPSPCGASAVPGLVLRPQGGPPRTVLPPEDREVGAFERGRLLLEISLRQVPQGRLLGLVHLLLLGERILGPPLVRHNGLVDERVLGHLLLLFCEGIFTLGSEPAILALVPLQSSLVRQK